MSIKKIDVDALNAVALSVRTLSMDAIQKADSGHPGLPLGCAEAGSLIFGEVLKHYPENPEWPDRDRFVLSAGHGSMLLYSLLHLSGYNLTVEDIKQFRQLNSKTPGHPEYGVTEGVETTTGPLGQGFANAVGMAMAEKHLASIFNTPEHKVVDHFTYVLAGDGDLMEGVSYEAASVAGHLGLGKLIAFYDSNRITIEGSTDIAFTEDIVKRFEGFHWHVQECDAYDMEKIASLVEAAKKESSKPSIIVLKSVIAKGAIKMEGSCEAHGAPLGAEEIKGIKIKLGLNENDMFYVHPGAYKYFSEKRALWKKECDDWYGLFKKWGEKNPALLAKWNEFFSESVDVNLDYDMFKVGDKVATRAASGKALNALASKMESLIGGSADLAPSNKSYINGGGDFQKDSPLGRNIHFGVREHVMGSILNGITLHKGLRAFGSTFLVFADYMRPPVRLAALMKIPVVYVFTHDSIYVGEDGPTHQPIEHTVSLRIIPGLAVLRPADAQETVAAWDMAIKNRSKPSALILTRQNIQVFEKADSDWKTNIHKGGYVVKDSIGEPEVVVIATGSEVSLVLDACKLIDSTRVRVVSVLCRGLFLAQDKAYREKVVPPSAKKLIVEAGVSYGWEGVAETGGNMISIDRFGESGPGEEVAKHLGYSTENIAAKIKQFLS